MELNNFLCNHLMPLHFKGLNATLYNHGVKVGQEPARMQFQVAATIAKMQHILRLKWPGAPCYM